jgi:hypothetical protein
MDSATAAGGADPRFRFEKFNVTESGLKCAY